MFHPSPLTQPAIRSEARRAMAATLPERIGVALLAAAREAFTDAVVLTATMSATLVIVAATVTATVLRDVRSDAPSTGEGTP